MQSKPSEGVQSQLVQELVAATGFGEDRIYAWLEGSRTLPRKQAKIATAILWRGIRGSK
jgi:hypothetical protein